MPTLDWIFLAVLLISLVVGAWRGLVYELLSVVNWIAAFVLAQWFAPLAAQWLALSSATEVVRYAAGFVLVFVLSLFAGGLIAFLMSKLVTAVGLRPVDRVLGAAFGLVRGVVLLLAFTVVFGMTPLVKGTLWQESAGASVATVVLQGLKPVLPQEFGKYLP
jgi:membrane protein required for colicin V production